MTAPIRIAIVDDEPLAREGLRIRLGRLPGVLVVAELGSAREAMEILPREKPDVLYLDIQMPEVDGFGLLAQLDRGPLPAIVFVTARADGALRAFRAGAIDYLVKPYDDETLRESLDRVRDYVEMARGARHPASQYLSRLSVKAGGQVRFLSSKSLDWIESAGDAVLVHVGSERFEYQSTMRELEETLDPTQFVRVHRTAIVAIRMIAGFEPYSAGEHLIVLSSGLKLPMSRRAKPRVVSALNGRA